MTAARESAPPRRVVTIGVPTYNRPDDLRRCLNELIGQTYPHLEIIVSDNASTDTRVAEVLQEAARDTRVRVVRQTWNVGATLNFQFVLNQARGDFFLWAGDDDFRAPDFVSRLLTALDATPDASVAFCDFFECVASGERAAGYPNHLPLLRAFESPKRWQRLISYFWQHEGLGKANLMYGLYRTDSLRFLDWTAFIERHGAWGADMLFVFHMLSTGPAAIAPDPLYRCTVGNAKAYASATAPAGLWSGWKARLAVVWRLVNHTCRYPALAPMPERLLILACIPAKIMALGWRLLTLRWRRAMQQRRLDGSPSP